MFLEKCLYILIITVNKNGVHIILCINEEIDFIIEDNKLKHGKYIPGVKIPIKSKSSKVINKEKILVLAWNFFNEIKKNNKDISSNMISIKNLEK